MKILELFKKYFRFLWKYKIGALIGILMVILYFVSENVFFNCSNPDFHKWFCDISRNNVVSLILLPFLIIGFIVMVPIAILLDFFYTFMPDALTTDRFLIFFLFRILFITLIFLTVGVYIEKIIRQAHSLRKIQIRELSTKS